MPARLYVERSPTADFRDWQDPQAYQAAFEQLLQALQTEAKPIRGPLCPIATALAEQRKPMHPSRTPPHAPTGTRGSRVTHEQVHKANGRREHLLPFTPLKGRSVWFEVRTVVRVWGGRSAYARTAAIVLRMARLPKTTTCCGYHGISQRARISTSLESALKIANGKFMAYAV